MRSTYETIKAQKERAENWVTRGAVIGLALLALVALACIAHLMPGSGMP